jgi:uncharacterized membrane protein
MTLDKTTNGVIALSIHLLHVNWYLKQLFYIPKHIISNKQKDALKQAYNVSLQIEKKLYDKLETVDAKDLHGMTDNAQELVQFILNETDGNIVEITMIQQYLLACKNPEIKNKLEKIIYNELKNN